MQKSPSLKHSLWPVTSLLLAPLASSAVAAPVDVAPPDIAPSVKLPAPATLPAPDALPAPAAAPVPSRKVALRTAPQGTVHRENAGTVVSASLPVDVQRSSTRIALQNSLPLASLQRSVAHQRDLTQQRTVKKATTARLVVGSAPEKTVTSSTQPPLETKSADVESRVPSRTLVAALPKEASPKEALSKSQSPLTRAETVEKNSVVLRRAQPTPLASRHRMPVGSAGDEMALLAQLERELQISKTQLRRANARLSEGQRELQKFNNVLRQAMMEAGPDAKGLHPFVRVAQRYAGTPYVWGGESARGFDCSGFIIRVMRDLGYKALPHSAAEQFKYGMPVAQPLLKPGDLVFFANTYKPGISHVGIYLGKRRFIHAAGTGLGTIVSNLDHPKYQAKYAGARRLVSVR